MKCAKDVGVCIPEILLPCKKANLSKWSVVACDQYTSQPEYWNKVEDLVGDEPSTLHMIFPEVYLEKIDKAKKIDAINNKMKEYFTDNILCNDGSFFVLVDRATSHTKSRKGLIIAVDLEKYDYNKGSQSLIRATEQTVVDRLPPRIKIRENAPVELPHIMILIDDREKTVIEPLAERVSQFEKIYDFELMMNGGHLKGYKICDDKSISGIIDALTKLASPSDFEAKYKAGSDKGVLLFAVGDGNHSLAAAKGHWENIKKTLPQSEIDEHPARFALVELVNVHDEGLQFEPIHRVVFNVSPDDLMKKLQDFYGAKASIKPVVDRNSLISEANELNKLSNHHVIPYVTSDGQGIIVVENPELTLEVGTLQVYLDDYIKNNPEVKIDYIHGNETVISLGSKPNCIGFLLPSMKKEDLYKTVIMEGALPRKTFSMGEAEEKRYYLECRKIIK